MKKLSLLLAILCSFNLLSNCVSQNQPNEIKSNIEYLASDQLMGRETGTPGNEMAAEFIAQKFREYGLASPEGVDGYLQNVALRKVIPPTTGTIAMMGKTYHVSHDMLTIDGEHLKSDAKFIFLDYGNSEKDYDGIDTKGKIIITRLGEPGASGFSRFSSMNSKRTLAQKHGATALVEMLDEEMPWDRIKNYFNRDRMEVINEADALPHFILKDFDQNMTKAVARQKSALAAIQSPGVSKSVISSKNVIGIVKGSDSKLADTFVMLAAHFDHVGAGMQKRGATQEDSIFNGARDNGMGVAALLYAANEIAAKPAKRSVAFLALTGEEIGLLGSYYYVQQPVIPLEKTVFVLNNDGAGVGDDSLITVIGLNMTTARDAIVQAADSVGLQAIADPVPQMHLFERSDNISFANKGIPAPTFSPGFTEFNEQLMARYHHPDDEIDADFPFAYLDKFCEAYALAARFIANMEDPPIWVAGSKYEELARELYNK